MCQLMDTPSWQPVARDLFQSEAAGIMLVEPQQSSNNSLCSHPRVQHKSIGNYLPQTPKKMILAPNSKPKIDPKNEAIFGLA